MGPMSKEVENLNTEEEILGTEPKVYEISFLFVPTITEENISAEFIVLKSLLETNGATFISEDFPKLINLAYTMSKVITNKKTRFETAYFGWIKFEILPEKIAEMKTILERNDKIIRFLTVRTIRESTLASKRVFTEGGSRRKFEAKNAEPKEEVNKETIDQEIDALVSIPA